MLGSMNGKYEGVCARSKESSIGFENLTYLQSIENKSKLPHFYLNFQIAGLPAYEILKTDFSSLEIR